MNKTKLLIVGLAIILGITSFVVYKAVSPSKQEPIVEEEPPRVLPEVDASVTVTVAKSRLKDNAVVLSVSGLGGTYETISYEMSYDTQGVIQGVTSQPLDVSGKDTFVRDDIYLGTCSRNVCRPHLGVKKISVAIEFISSSGQKSQFSKDFQL